MEPDRELMRALRRERIERARRQHPMDKLYMGAKLYDIARERMAMGVRAQMPDAEDAEVQRVVLQRLARIKRLGDRPC